MDISPIVTRGIMSARSNAILYKMVNGEWVATVYLGGYARISTLPSLDIHETSEDVVELVEEISGGKFNPNGWVVYGKRLDSEEARQFRAVSHWQCASSGQG